MSDMLSVPKSDAVVARMEPDASKLRTWPTHELPG